MHARQYHGEFTLLRKMFTAQRVRGVVQHPSGVRVDKREFLKCLSRSQTITIAYGMAACCLRNGEADMLTASPPQHFDVHIHPPDAAPSPLFVQQEGFFLGYSQIVPSPLRITNTHMGFTAAYTVAGSPDDYLVKVRPWCFGCGLRSRLSSVL
jgi:hypothetical protein